jgi:hypothetical protein
VRGLEDLGDRPSPPENLDGRVAAAEYREVIGMRSSARAQCSVHSPYMLEYRYRR